MLQRLVFFLFIFLSCLENSNAQIDSLVTEKAELNISGFVDIYYAYDFNQPSGSARQYFLYNHNRHNEFNLNLGLIKLNLEHSKYRANLALHTGTYVNDNYANEPSVLKNIYEANAGISLSKKNNVWIDAGIFSSYIGFESAVSMDNLTLTRSLSAESSPYFMTGAKITYTPSKYWELSALALNGWQRIQKVQSNSLLSSGTQVRFLPSEKITVNWSTFIGTDDPDSTRRMRYFNNLYTQFTLSQRLSMIAGFDLGLQQKNKKSSSYNTWLSPTIILKYLLNENWSVAFRGEYYQDENGVIVPTGTPNGFKTTGFSCNIDYLPYSNIACRLEGRWLSTKDKILERNNSLINDSFFIVGSVAVKLIKE